ncbi:oligoendopeptidase F [Helicobacter valdiviensis]|uniref:Oligoendopeptidase F n=1 Tax=Helicobacter valdiviensis TaxID=1458358 RepID=A0A2W6NJH2_9HELI|nr:M3 family oligoendopeptidase [Helicobacter valdiviensis]PZT49090.1 oligoendopeptidase F [Helicobacter valdiviensis]
MKEKIDKWDLTPLFQDKEELKKALNRAISNAKEFEARNKGNLTNIEAGDFYDLMCEYEKNCQDLAKIMTYAFLTFASDTKEGAFYSECELEANKANEHLLFFELEFNTLSKEKQSDFIKNAKNYSYYLELLLKNSKYQLTLKEERILLKSAPVGADAFSRLFDEHLSALRFKLDNQEMGEEEILSLLHDGNREIRKKAATSLSNTLRENLPLLTYIYNIIRKDLKITAELRGYESLEEFRHLSNQTTQKSVDMMVDCINQNVELVEQYYFLKNKIIGYDKLYDYDRYAPLGITEERAYSYEEAKEVVLETFKGFSNNFYEIAKSAFKEGWIDSHPRENKRGGAFSHGCVPEAHPYLMLNHTNQRRDVFTLAHELGHTIHQNLSYKVGYLNADTPLTTAETASVFAEMLLFDKMKEELQGKERISLYAGKLEDIFATLFRQNVFTNFERRIHRLEGELSSEEISKIWQEENQKMFGKSVELSEDYSIWWSYIPHFIHSPFYCYAYSYGQLLVMALFGLYKKDRMGFVQKYETFLSLGGSKSPKELVALFGFDIESLAFWEIGMGEVKHLLEEFKLALG